MAANEANVAQGFRLFRIAATPNAFHINVQVPGSQLRLAWNEEAGPVIIGNPLDADNRVGVPPPLRLGVEAGVENPFPGFIDARGMGR